jgi:hypothetical protein
MAPVLFGSLLNNHFWHLLPLLISVCLVYGATRHELMGPILMHALRFGIWIVGFMGVIFVLLCLMSWNL